MTALKIIGVILLIFLLIGLLRVGAIVSFGEELTVKLRIGAIKLTILPRKKPKKAKKPGKEKEKKPKEADSEEPSEKKKRKLPKLSFDEIMDLAETALSALGRLIRRVCKRLRIDPLDLAVVIGGEDPAVVAQSFGYADAAMFALMPKAEELFYIPDPSIRLGMDFSAESTRAEGTVGLSLRVCDLFAFVFTLLIPMGRWFLRYKKAHKGDRPHRGAPAAEKSASGGEQKDEEKQNEELIA